MVVGGVSESRLIGAAEGQSSLLGRLSVRWRRVVRRGRASGLGREVLVAVAAGVVAAAPGRVVGRVLGQDPLAGRGQELAQLRDAELRAHDVERVIGRSTRGLYHRRLERGLYHRDSNSSRRAAAA